MNATMIEINESGLSLNFTVKIRKQESATDVFLFLVPMRINDTMAYHDDIIYYNRDWSECGSMYGLYEDQGEHLAITCGMELDSFGKNFDRAFVLLQNTDRHFCESPHLMTFNVNSGLNSDMPLSPGGVLASGHHLVGVVQKSEQGWQITQCLHAQETLIPHIFPSMEFNEHVNMAWCRAQLGFAGVTPITQSLRADQLPWMNPAELDSFFEFDYSPAFAREHGMLPLLIWLEQSSRVTLTPKEQAIIQQLVVDGASWASALEKYNLRLSCADYKAVDLIEGLLNRSKNIESWILPILRTFSDADVRAYAAISQNKADRLYKLWPREDLHALASPAARKERLSHDFGL